MRPATVVIADSQRLFAESLVGALVQQPGLRPVEEVALSGRRAVEMAVQLAPDVVMIDQWIGELDAVEATAAIRQEAPLTEVLVISGLPGPRQVQAALSAGAAGFLPKTVGVADLAEAVNRVHRGESPVFMEELWRMVETINERAEQTDVVDTRLADLSEREQEVVRLLAEGRLARDLPGLLFISEGTLRNHLHKILKKTGARTIQELLRLVRNGAPVAAESHPAVEAWEPPSSPGHGISVLVADEQRLFAEALGHALLDVHDLAVLGAYSRNGVDALHAAVTLAPMVFIYDYWMPATSGRAVARYLARWAPETRVVFLSWLHGGEHVADAARSGAAGLVSKKVSLRQLADTIRDAAAGRPLVHAASLSKRYAEARRSPRADDELFQSLTPRELEVLQLVGQGRSFHDISRHLDISAGTAKNHLSNVLRKTGSRSRLEAVELARQAGYVREPGTPPS